MELESVLLCGWVVLYTIVLRRAGILLVARGRQWWFILAVVTVGVGIAQVMALRSGLIMPSDLNWVVTFVAIGQYAFELSRFARTNKSNPPPTPPKSE
jgi:hypothetical protein